MGRLRGKNGQTYTEHTGGPHEISESKNILRAQRAKMLIYIFSTEKLWATGFNERLRHT